MDFFDIEVEILISIALTTFMHVYKIRFMQIGELRKA
jgi:hypothetical protein